MEDKPTIIDYMVWALLWLGLLMCAFLLLAIEETR